MSNPPETPLPQSVAIRRRLRYLKIFSLLSILFLCFNVVANTPQIFPVSLIFTVPAAFLYVWAFVRLRGKTPQKGLALAGAMGSLGLPLGLLMLRGAATNACDPGALGLLIVGLFPLSQLVLVFNAIAAYYTLKHQGLVTSKLGSEIATYALAVGLGFLILLPFVDPNAVRSRFAGNGGNPVGSLRTINTAEITYASTYNAGYSKVLADLQPPALGSNPTATAAGLIDSVLAGGEKYGYRIEYKPGPVEKERIDTYTITSRPLKYGCYGENSYFSDQSGVIRRTRENRPATANDPAVQ